MTHFNHEWDTTKTPAVPVSVGDRYYAQDLNDDFNYLKHLPYEVFLQGRSRGVMVAPSDTWDSANSILTLSGGFGVVSQDCIELDPDEDFVIPPKTKSSSRYERISFADTVLPFDISSELQYIVATPTKRSLLQRTKAIFTEQYASRVKYDGVITIQNTAPTAGQILIGLCQGNSYCLLIDNNPDQCKDNIILKKWFGEAKIRASSFISALQSYYNTSTASIETTISIGTTLEEDSGIDSGTFNNCNITINTVSSISIGIEGIFNNCNITINSINGGRGLGSATCNNCTISINTVSGANGWGIHSGTFNNCNISIDMVNGSGRGIEGGTFKDCIITIDTVINASRGVCPLNCDNCTITITTISNQSLGTYGDKNINHCTITIGLIQNSAIGFDGGTINNSTITIDSISNSGYGVFGDINRITFNNCTIFFGGVNGVNSIGIEYATFNHCDVIIDGGVVDTSYGIDHATFNNCNITIGGANSSSIENGSDVVLYLTLIKCSAITDLSSTSGKLNVLNDTVFHAS